MKRIVGRIVAVLSLVFAGSALASPPPSVEITTVIGFTSFPATAPWQQTYGGTYTSSTGDSGTLTADAVFGAVPTGGVNLQGKPNQSAPNSVLQTLMTLTSANANTPSLVLRCTQHAAPADFATYPIVPSSGSCAVLSATDGYAGLAGSGRMISGVADFTNATVTDTIALG